MKNIKTREELNEGKTLTGALPRDVGYPRPSGSGSSTRNVVDDFFNKVTKDLDKKYFPAVKYYGDDKDAAKVHHSVELYSNGALTYDKLISQLSAACKDSKDNIERIVSAYFKK